MSNRVLDEAKLIAVDWGTSSFRAWLLGEAGSVLAEIPSGAGILAVADGDFDAALEKNLAPFIGQRHLPVIASGMITSRNGWVETSYLPLPLDAEALAQSIKLYETASGRKIHFVTGAVRNPDDGLPDVMRGEETEIIGHLCQSAAQNGLFVLPGTHSKWAIVTSGQITHFQTCMTGEIFALLRQHSILGRLMTDGSENPDAFRRGVEASRTEGALLARIFSARSLALLGRLDGKDIADYLSGLLIGDEVFSTWDGHSSVIIIGRGDLAERYRIALTQIGSKAEIAPPGMARAGLWHIADIAGVIT